MARPHETGFDIGHPAPDRGKIGGWTIAFGVLGAVAAWCLQLVVGSSLTGIACASGDGPGGAGAGIAWALPAAVAVNLAAIVLAATAMAVSYRNLRRTRVQTRGHPGGLVDVGEGRTRFLSIWGILAGVLFVLAIGFNTMSVMWGGLC